LLAPSTATKICAVSTSPVCRNHDEAKKDAADRAAILAAERQLKKGVGIEEFGILKDF
jgi:hypothetical protein